jgi:uncharacterized RDD family membrane protein YckC
MKCPKCGYLGFQQVDRCRNCGYDFSLTAEAPAPDLPIRRDADSDETLPDLTLELAAAAPQVRGDVPLNVRQPRAAGAATAPKMSELPLFGDPIPDDQPLIAKASPPRQPLAVRRASPEVPRIRAEQPRIVSFDLTTEPDADATIDVRSAAGVAGFSPTAQHTALDYENAGLIARFFAAAIDLAILAAVDVLVVYFTLQICGLALSEMALLPKGPLIAFLLVQNVGYLVAFTVGGQTLGKMTAGIRVVSVDARSTLDVGRAFVRTAMWLLLAIPGGLGLLTAVFSRDRRGLHDRLAGTRVVR